MATMIELREALYKAAKMAREIRSIAPTHSLAHRVLADDISMLSTRLDQEAVQAHALAHLMAESGIPGSGLLADLLVDEDEEPEPRWQVVVKDRHDNIYGRHGPYMTWTAGKNAQAAISRDNPGRTVSLRPWER